MATYLDWLGVWDDMFMCVLQLSIRCQADKGGELVRITHSEMGSPLSFTLLQGNYGNCGGDIYDVR